MLEALIREGVDVVRLNFSHGTAQDHIDRATMVREVAKRAGREVAIMADLQGPKIRVGKFAEGKVFLEHGQPFILDAGRTELGDVNAVGLDYKSLPQEVKAGDVLLRVAEVSDWKNRHSLPKGTAKGLAFYYSHLGYFAEVVQATVSASGAIKLDHVWAVGDIGRQIINPTGAEHQVQGAALDGLGAALGQAVTIENGRVVQANFDSVPPLRIDQAPQVDVHFVTSDFPPTGLGEPALPPVLPALCNAIFAATGKRIRSLPIDTQLLKA
jgi:isoquinoline 1-oxidoreductase beta subunit